MSSFLFWLSGQPGIFWKRGFIREFCGAGSDCFKFEGQTPSEKQPRLFEKPDSDKDARNVGVGVSECAWACICGLSLSYRGSPARGAAASLHSTERER